MHIMLTPPRAHKAAGSFGQLKQREGVSAVSMQLRKTCCVPACWYIRGWQCRLALVVASAHGYMLQALAPRPTAQESQEP